MYSKKFEEYDKQCCYYLSDFEEWFSCGESRLSITLSRSMGRYIIFDCFIIPRCLAYWSLYNTQLLWESVHVIRTSQIKTSFWATNSKLPTLVACSISVDGWIVKFIVLCQPCKLNKWWWCPFIYWKFFICTYRTIAFIIE